MRRIRELPMIRCRIHQDVNQRGLGERGAQEEPDRIHREDDINRGNVAITGIFLSEEERLFVGIRGQAVGRDTFAIRKRHNLRILFSADLGQIGGQFLIEDLAAGKKLGILSRSLLQKIIYRDAIASPIRNKLRFKILDGIDLVVGNDHLPLHYIRSNFTKIEGISQYRLNHGRTLGQLASWLKEIARLLKARFQNVI